jgi:type I restriction enzyme M protein
MLDKYHRFIWENIPTSDADWLFVQHLLSILKDNGKGIIALPSGALFNAVLNRTREEAILTKFIECIITLPHGMLLPYTAIPISLMVINKAKVSDAKVLMIQAEGLFPDIQTIRRRDASRLDDYVIKRICEIYQDNTETAGISSLADTDTLRKNNWVLIPARYIRSETIETEYGNVIVKNPADDWISLRSAGKFYTGINVAPYAKADEIGEYRIINLADVQGGEVQPEHLTRYSIESRTRAEKYKVKQGDILISCKGAAIKVCVIPEHTENVLMSINFIGIRIYQEKFNPLFIKYYLESPAGQIFLQSKQVGTSIITLTARDLEDIPLPNLPFDEQNEYVKELTDIEERIRIEKENLYTLSKNAKWNFYESIGLGKIMKKEEV